MFPQELFSYEGVDILIPFLQMDPKKLYSGLGHNHLLFSALDCLWLVKKYFSDRNPLEMAGLVF